jgi:hypothetical protein
MRKFSLLGAIVGLGALAAPSGALARDGSNCDYAASQAVPVKVVDTGPTGNQVYVYEGSGVSGTATVAAGTCVNLTGNSVAGLELEGGTLEAGGSPTNGVAGVQSTAVTPAEEVTGVPGAYAVVDGDNDNTGTSTNADQGYAGVSNYEAPGSTTDTSCDGNPEGVGTNSGGCVDVKGTPVKLPIPLIVCGNTGSNQFESSRMDGCSPIGDFTP